MNASFFEVLKIHSTDGLIENTTTPTTTTTTTITRVIIIIILIITIIRIQQVLKCKNHQHPYISKNGNSMNKQPEERNSISRKDPTRYANL